MARIAMTDAQKDALSNDPTFQALVKWSIIDQAVSTKGNDGTGIAADATLRKQWAQWKPLAAQVVNNPSIANGGINNAIFFVGRFSALLCWDNSVSGLAAQVADCITYLQTQNVFGANAAAQAWFDQQVSLSPW